MKLVYALLFTALLANTVLAQSGCIINTPSPPRQCTFAVVAWGDCALPVTLVILDSPGGEVIDGPFTVDSGTDFAWLARFPAGTNVDFRLMDAAGDAAQSAIITIRPGPTDC
ncbi:hypothetical protein BV20DRAFT_758165 [Pilatotrama ljubarskyi]|nr:hypothetical protein BV20DRAFT_758165 [Pilatotrama ljubarskyi]